jgi:hypothetical protein
MLPHLCLTCIRHGYFRDTAACMTLECPNYYYYLKKKWILTGYGPKIHSDSTKSFIFILVSILKSYLIFTLLDLGLYSKNHLMAIDLIYYP